MKKALLIVSCILAITACNQHDKAAAKDTGFTPTENIFAEKLDSANFTNIRWIDNDLDFGKVDEGQQVPVEFRFINSGTKPLIIYSVQPSCGCTAAEPPSEPIQPGKQGSIKGSFNSKGRAGTNNKSIYVQANTNGGVEHILHFKVEVNKK